MRNEENGTGRTEARSKSNLRFEIIKFLVLNSKEQNTETVIIFR